MLRYGMFIWKRIPEQVLEKHSGIKNLVEWFQAGCPEEEDCSLIFFNGEEQVGSFDNTPPEDGYFIGRNLESDKYCLAVWFLMEGDPASFDPQISVSDECGLGMPDECIVTRALKYTVEAKVILPSNCLEKVETVLEKFSEHEEVARIGLLSGIHIGILRKDGCIPDTTSSLSRCMGIRAEEMLPDLGPLATYLKTVSTNWEENTFRRLGYVNEQFRVLLQWDPRLADGVSDMSTHVGGVTVQYMN